jgi:tetratricopeptide (TPR) repeat protein/capsular polysaccharide biosynthesis protein
MNTGGSENSGAGGGAPGDPQQIFALAVEHYQNGRFAEAETELLKIQARQPDVPDVLHLLSIILLQTERPEDAINHLEKMIAVIPEQPELLDLLASALGRVGRLDEAVALSEQSVALGPENPEAQFNLGIRLEALERWPEAASAYQRAMDLAPDFLDAHHNFGLALKAGGLLETAADALGGLIDADPGNVEAHCRLGNIAREMGNAGAAETHYRKAIELNPAFGRGHYHLGQLFLKAGDLGAAIGCFEAMLAFEPRLADVAFNSDPALAGIAEFVSARPAELRNLQALRAFQAADLEQHCATSKTRYKVFEKLDVHPLGVDQPVEGHGLFLAQLKDGGVLGGSNLPVTRGGAFFSHQLIHNEHRLMTDPGYQKRESVVLAIEQQIVSPVFEEKEFSGAHILIGSHENFGHWMLNNFARLALINDEEALKSLPVVVGDDLSGTRLECLARFGIGEDRIVRVPPGQIAWFEELWVPSFPYFAEPTTLMWAPAVIHFIRTALDIPQERALGKPPRRLFLTRRNAQWRHLANEDEIVVALQPFGFESIELADLSLDEQIALASEADIILGPFGAAMNLHLFAPQGTHVVELKFSESAMDIHPTLAGEIGQFHHSITCQRANSSGYLLNDDLVAPVDEVVALARTLTQS